MPWRPPASAKFGNDLVMENVNGNDLVMRIYCTLEHIVKFSHVRAQNERRMLYYTINLISGCFRDVYGKKKNNPLINKRLKNGGADRDRTDDLRLAKPALSQLSYSPVLVHSAGEA